MPKKKSKSIKRRKARNTAPAPAANEPESVDAEAYAAEKYRDYGIYVNEDRAIPEYRDGLKPVQRRVLYEMWNAGVRPGGNYRKSAAIVGGVMANWHPHGDSAIYDAMVNLVNPTPMVMSATGGHPFSAIDPQGNFGAPPRRHHPAAAMRYTEVRLSALGAVHFECMGVADMVANFSGEKNEPVVLPTRLPLLLLLGSSGVGVGASTEIPRHGLKAVIDTALYVLRKGGKASLKGAVKKLGGPDYGHSYVTSDEDAILDMYREGKGTIRFMADHHIRRGKDSHELVVTSYAPGMSVDTLIRRLTELEDANKIIAFNNETDSEGPRITVLFRDPTVIEERVLPAIQSHASYTWNVIDKTDPNNPLFRRMDLLTYMNAWLDWRREVETEVLKLEREETRTKLAREQAKMAASQNAEALGKIMGSKKPYDEKKKQIAKQVKFRWGKKTKTLTDAQVEYLLDQKIRSMDRLNADRQKTVIKGLLATLKRIKKDLGEIDRVIADHLLRIKKSFAKVIKAWTPSTLAYGIPELELPEGENAEGFWHFTDKGFCRAYTELPTRKGKFPEGFLVPAEETVTIVESSGWAYARKSVFLSHGRTEFDNVVGVAQSTCDILMVMDEKGNTALVDHPAKTSEYAVMRMDEEAALTHAWACTDSDTVYAFGSSRWESHKVSKLGTKRPNSMGRKLLTRARNAPRVFVVPKGGVLVCNGKGVIDPDDVRPNHNIFAVGKKNYVVTLDNRKMVCNARQAASWAESNGLAACFILR